MKRELILFFSVPKEEAASHELQGKVTALQELGGTILNNDTFKIFEES